MAGARARGRAGWLGMRNPVRALWRVVSRGQSGTLLIARALPGPTRRAIGRATAGVAERAARRQRRLAPLAFVAAWAAGRGGSAVALAEERGTSAATPPDARRALAGLAAETGRLDAAGRILDSLPDDSSAEAELLRARILLERGQYGLATTHGKRAARGGRPAGASIVALAEARLRALSPDWTPDLGAGLARLEQLRHTPVIRGRILHLGSVSLPYKQVGYTLRSQLICQCQRAAGLDPHFATRAGYPVHGVIGRVPPRQVIDGIPYHRLALGFREGRFDDQLITATARAAASLLERLRPAALQPVSNHFQAQVALAIGRPAGIKVVYEVRGFLEETWAAAPRQDEAEALDTEHYLLTREAETRAMLAADAVVTLSETMRDAIVERGCPAERVVIVPNAVDADRFRPRPRDAALASSLGIGPDESVVGYVTTFSPYEGIPYLLEAAAGLRAAGRRVKVLLVGEGRHEDAIRQAAGRLGLDDGVLIMPGRVPHAEITRWYSLIDVFVVPRTADRVSRLVTPLKPYEAMALERAVVVSDVPALREMVASGETGLTFRAEDAADLQRVLAGLLDDEGLRQRLGRQAREWVAAERSWARNGRLYRELYERLGVA